MNHPHLVWMRQQMLENKPVPRCVHCHRDEELGSQSERQLMLRQHPTRPADVRLTSVDLSLGNLCNMKCRMCWSGESTRWIADDRRWRGLNLPVVRRKVDDFKLDLASITHLRLKGGEPSLEQDTIADILDAVQAAQGSLSNLYVNIITNAQRPFRDDILDRLYRCGSFDISCSVDGVGKVNDYQRVGARWPDIAATIMHYADRLGENICLQCTVSIFNIAGWLDLVRWIDSNLTDRGIGMNSNLVYKPSWMNCSSIPQPRKMQLIQQLIEADEYDHLVWYRLYRQVLINRLREPAEHAPIEVLQGLDALDAMNHTRFADIDPMTDAALRAYC